MSLTKGTLVILKNMIAYPEFTGKIGEIKEELKHMYFKDYRTGALYVGSYYGVVIPSIPSHTYSGLWYLRPNQVIPITPPDSEESINQIVKEKETA